MTKSYFIGCKRLIQSNWLDGQDSITDGDRARSIRVDNELIVLYECKVF